MDLYRIRVGGRLYLASKSSSDPYLVESTLKSPVADPTEAKKMEWNVLYNIWKDVAMIDISWNLGKVIHSVRTLARVEALNRIRNGVARVEYWLNTGTP